MANRPLHEWQMVFEQTVQNALLVLLQEKHLYQSSHLDFDQLKQALDSRNALEHELHSTIINASDFIVVPRKENESAEELINRPWHFDFEYGDGSHAKPIPPAGAIPTISLPTIRVPCSMCSKTRQPHNPGYRSSRGILFQEHFEPYVKTVQLFVLPFQCQNCKGEPLVFMVRREGLKLTLVGRSHFEQVAVPDFIPKDVAKYYTGAEIAFNTGHPLAAIFYLRTLIEQYMQSIVQPADRVTGDELAEAYAKTLPVDFKERYPSFSKIYDDLSGAMHEAREDEAVFKHAIEAINAHFKAKPHFMVPRKASM